VEADREVKVLIKLRDRKQREEQAAENRRETKFLDEVAGRNVTARLET
jgi:flagellar export protein FliJ